MVAALVFLSPVPVRAADPTGAQSVGISVVKADTNHKIGDRYTYRIEGDGYMHQTSGQRGGACAERHSIFKIWIVPDKVRRFIAQDYIQEGAAIGCRKYVTTRTELMSFVPGEPAARAESTAVVETPVIIPRSATVEEPPHSQSND